MLVLTRNYSWSGLGIAALRNYSVVLRVILAEPLRNYRLRIYRSNA
jgi:hypothetical protein